MIHDAIVVGGSYAGLSAALQLARARRQVLVIDAGSPRNRVARAAHGFLGQDGKSPRHILREAEAQLLAYPAATLAQGEAATARKTDEGFVVTMSDGQERRATRLILATGVHDELPPIQGMQERWGSTVVLCPYCHGYEFGGQELGVLANHPMSARQAVLIPDWGPTTYFTQGAFEPDDEQLAKFAARGVRVERSPVTELLGAAPGLEAVRLGDGRVVPLSAVFIGARTHVASPLAAQLGCAVDDGSTGQHIRVDGCSQTTIGGVYAAGDAASPLHALALAAASGGMAGVWAHHSIIEQAASRKGALAGRPG